MRARLLRHSLATGLLLAGCSGDGFRPCDIDGPPALVVMILDAVDGRLLADSAHAVVVDGAFQDSLRPYNLLYNGGVASLALWRERPATYRLTITRPGYLQWEDRGIRIRPASCGITPVRLDAFMSRDAVP